MAVWGRSAWEGRRGQLVKQLPKQNTTTRSMTTSLATDFEVDEKK